MIDLASLLRSDNYTTADMSYKISNKLKNKL